MELFDQLYYLEKSLALIEQKKNQANDNFFMSIRLEHESEIEKLSSQIDDISYSDYNEIAAKHLRAKTKEKLDELKQYNLAIKNATEEILGLKRSISYYSVFSIWEFLEIINIFDHKYKIIYIGDNYYLAPMDYQSIQFLELRKTGELLKLPKSGLIQIYDSELQLNDCIKSVVDESILEFIHYIIAIKMQDKYMMIDRLYQEFCSEKGCNRK